ncbi:MAG: CoA pyrophosphatase [Dehalococcoidia bacterium]|nr:CoA pyrophosphatase [Dehalococcoidia bacterium]
MSELTRQKITEALLNNKKKRNHNSGLTPSAVLVPLFYREEQCYLLFTRRSERVNFHKGEFCFPGGTHEEYDSTLLQTALREASEEIGLKSRDAEILGELDDCITRNTHYVISPFVTFIPYPYTFKLDGKEVEQILTVPLSILVDETFSGQNSYHTGEGKTEDEISYEYAGYTIFGATARILRQFIHILCPKNNGYWKAVPVV